MKLFNLFFAVLFVSAPSIFARVWMSNDGRALDGDLVSFTESTVEIKRMADGRILRFNRSLLSASDNKYLDELSLEEAVNAFLTNCNDNLEEGSKEAAKKKLATYVFYERNFIGDEFNEFIYTYLMDERFLQKIKREALLVIIRGKDSAMDDASEDWYSKNPSPAAHMFYEGKPVTSHIIDPQMFSHSSGKMNGFLFFVNNSLNTLKKRKANQSQ